MDRRYAAAKALGGNAETHSIHAIRALAEGCSEVSTRKALLETLADCESADR